MTKANSATRAWVRTTGSASGTGSESKQNGCIDSQHENLHCGFVIDASTASL